MNRTGNLLAPLDEKFERESCVHRYMEEVLKFSYLQASSDNLIDATESCSLKKKKEGITIKFMKIKFRLIIIGLYTAILWLYLPEMDTSKEWQLVLKKPLILHNQMNPAK